MYLNLGWSESYFHHLAGALNFIPICSGYKYREAAANNLKCKASANNLKCKASASSHFFFRHPKLVNTEQVCFSSVKNSH